ncbi:hypothetical protein DFS21_11213 [Pseudomonas sp. 2848]|uniref:hypothetical protein n=1 Tax=Pseudomonas sp. 2848 TaxID=2183926 RepID=UPI000DB1D71F|nr:hypothetical protein [Pseudomonas sp. 2848]PZW75499.1 hypothetical protein DFS21_11213 [Pseudomonas sp. 2848]
MKGNHVGRDSIQSYINSFRKYLSVYIKPSLGVKCEVRTARDGGAVIVFEFGNHEGNQDTYKMQSSSVNKALSRVRQNSFGGNLDGFSFKGTNIIMEESGIVIIKDGNPKEWTEEAAKADVEKIVPRQFRG